MKRSSGLIIIGTLLDIIALHLGRRDVAVVDMHALVGLFVKNVVVVEERKWFNARIVGKVFLPIQTILIHVHTATCRPRHHEFKEQGEEVHVAILRHHGISQPHIDCIIQSKLTINIAPPHHIFTHWIGRWER